MKLFHFNIFLFLLAVGVIHSQNKSKKTQNSEVIIFNKNTAESFSVKELQMLKEVYGNELQKEILNRPSRVLSVKEILRNRVLIQEVSDPKYQKPCTMLSDIPVFDAFVKDLERDKYFDLLSFNPLKYDFKFHSPSIQLIRVDDTDIFITIKPQHYNTK